MFHIRPEHLQGLNAQQTEGFASRMTQHLREVFPEEVLALDDPALRAFVEKVCAQAGEWDVTDESHVERLIELYASFESIRSNPVPEWLSRLARDPNRSADRFVSELEVELRFGDHTS